MCPPFPGAARRKPRRGKAAQPDQQQSSDRADRSVGGKRPALTGYRHLPLAPFMLGFSESWGLNITTRFPSMITRYHLQGRNIICWGEEA